MKKQVLNIFINPNLMMDFSNILVGKNGTMFWIISPLWCFKSGNFCAGSKKERTSSVVVDVIVDLK